jgi:hypothetical protein
MPCGAKGEEKMAVTVTYYVRGGNTLINGSTTAPTAAQASQVMKQSAVIVFGVAGDVANALFTHNWGLDASAPTYNEPEIIMSPVSSTTSWPMISFYRANTNVLQVMRPAGDAPTTIVVQLRRPHSAGQ